MVSSIGGSTVPFVMPRLDTSQTSAKVGGGGTGGTPPAAASGASAVASSTSQSSSTTKTYDPADTNQDGTVSAQELLAYLSAQASKSVSASQSDNVSGMKQMLSNAYGNSSQDASQSIGRTLSVRA